MTEGFRSYNHDGTPQHRWVTEEPHIPFDLTVLYEDENIIVVDKPHFLATMPRGMWYRETALMRLREQYDEPDIIPAHRLDRLTAGVLVFVRNKAVRGAYQTLFQEHRTSKVYECLAPVMPIMQPQFGTIERIAAPRPFPLIRRSHINKDRGRLQAYESNDWVNAETLITRGTHFDGTPALPIDVTEPYVVLRGMREPQRMQGEWFERPSAQNVAGQIGSRNGLHSSRGLAATDGEFAEVTRLLCYTLYPHTGKTHQLRVHMNSIGLPIAGDDFYPIVKQRDFDDFEHPLQLVARTLDFDDPLTGDHRHFESQVPLAW